MFSSNITVLSCSAAANRGVHGQGRVLDPADEPVPKHKGVLFILFLGYCVSFLVCPQERSQTGVTGLMLAGDKPESSPCGGRIGV